MVMSRNFSAVIERDPNGHSQREEGGLRDYPEGVEYQSPGSRSVRGKDMGNTSGKHMGNWVLRDLPLPGSQHLAFDQLVMGQAADLFPAVEDGHLVVPLLDAHRLAVQAGPHQD